MFAVLERSGKGANIHSRREFFLMSSGGSHWSSAESGIAAVPESGTEWSGGQSLNLSHAFV